jgi:hypothetical protein
VIARHGWSSGARRAIRRRAPAASDGGGSTPAATRPFSCTLHVAGLSAPARNARRRPRALLDPDGRPASQVHTARLRPPRWELVWRPAVWEELERRGATVAIVPFSGRAGRGGQTDTIKLLRLEREKLVDVERWTSRDELCNALEAPIWDRLGTFVGQPLVSGEVIWTADGRDVAIRGMRGGRPFEEIVP